MKSKISFFNKTIFWKNVTLYWPIWVIYTAILVLFQSVNFWIYASNWKYYPDSAYSDHLNDFIGVLYLDMHVGMIAVMVLFTGTALFQYLYNQKSANMIHALPVDRTQLFGTNVISGLLFLAVPQTISALLLILAGLCNGIAEVYTVFYWLFMVFGIDIVAMAIITICAMLTGHLLALPVYAVIINGFSYWVYFLIILGASEFGFGLNSFANGGAEIAELFSPVACFYRHVGVCMDFNEIGECVGALTYGKNILFLYLLVSIVLYVLAYIAYQKRHIEQAGEFITISWLKPVFCVGTEITGGFFGGMVVKALLESMGVSCKGFAEILLVFGLGILSYFTAKMIIQKSFHVFEKKNWKGCAVSTVLLFGVCLGLYGMAKISEDYQPKLEDIAYASINMDYAIEFEGENAAAILNLQKEILENKKLCIQATESGVSHYEYVYIHYDLNNGKKISRTYEVPTGFAETDAVLKKISTMQHEKENYLNYVFGNNYENIEVFYGGWCDIAVLPKTSENTYEEDVEYETFSFSEEQAKEMYDAVIADVNAGNLMKYNIDDGWLQEEADTYLSYAGSSISIVFQRPVRKEDAAEGINMDENSSSLSASGEIYIQDNTTTYSASTYFGPDCEHIINKLIEYGVISSVDDIYWGDME